MSARTLVIGGGIVGACQAWCCAARGLETVWVAPRLREGDASRAAAGMLAPVSEAEDEPIELWPFADRARRAYPAFLASLGEDAARAVDYHEADTLWVAVDDDQAAEWDRTRERLRARGRRPRRLARDEWRSLEPQLGPRVRSAFRVEGDGRVDPVRLIERLTAACATRGVLRIEETVERLEVRGGRVTGAIAGGRRIEAARTVVCAGVHTDRLLEPIGLSIGVRPVKGQVVLLSDAPNLEHTIRTPDVYLVPRAGGALAIGATEEELGHDLRPTAGAALELLARAWQVVPDVYEATWRELRVGSRPATPHRVPAAGRLGPAGLWVHAGHHRNGVLWAPWLAGGVAEAIATDAPSVDPVFDPSPCVETA